MDVTNEELAVEPVNELSGIEPEVVNKEIDSFLNEEISEKNKKISKEPRFSIEEIGKATINTPTELKEQVKETEELEKTRENEPEHEGGISDGK